MADETGRTADYFYGLARSYLRGCSKEDARVIAELCVAADRAGQNCSIYHQSAIHFGHRCNCVQCNRSAA